MKLRMLYNSAAVAIPLAAAACAGRATAEDWRVLFTVAAGGDPNALGLAPGVLDNARALWTSAGIMTCGEPSAIEMPADGAVPAGITLEAPELNAPAAVNAVNEPSAAESEPSVNPEPRPLGVHPSRGVPTYTSEELAGFIEKNAGTQEFLHRCEELMHRIFNVAETNILLGLREYFGLSGDYILLLVDYMERGMSRRTPNRHVTVSALERRAIALIEEGIDTYPRLETKVREWERTETLETKVRAVFGLGSRRLTAKEEDCLRRWRDMELPDELLTLAYDRTVDATSKPSLAYADKIICRWNSEGIKTAADAENERKSREAKLKEENGSFDTDDFFKSAVARSFD